MANYFAQLAAPQIRNALVDFSPVGNALDTWREQGNADRQFGMQQKQIDAQTAERTYQHGRDAKQDSRQAVMDYGKQASAVDQIQDPAQRAGAWNSIISKHGATGLTPEELDPITGPKLMAAQAGMFLDPRDSQAKDLDLQKTRAEIGKLNAEAANGSEAYGKTGSVVQGSDGKYYSVQFGSRGQRQILPLELGGTPGNGNGAAAPPVSLAPQRGVDVVGDQMYDKATGAPVRNVAPNIAGGEAAKITGRETAEGQMNLPKSQIALEQSKIQNDVVTDSIDKALTQADGYTSGFTGSITSNIPGTKAYDLSNTLNTVKANLGFDKLQSMRDNSPTGGALGQVSEMENRLLQSVWGSVEQSQSPAQLKTNLGKIKSLRNQYQDLKQKAYDMDVARFGKANVPDLKTGQLPAQAQAPGAAPAAAVKNGNYRYNPQTGNLEPME